MPEFILALIGEGKNPSKDLELRIEGEVPEEGQKFTIDKEYPRCRVFYKVERVERGIYIQRDSKEPYKLTTRVCALRRPGGFKINP